jgi:hypothetical protein
LRGVGFSVNNSKKDNIFKIQSKYLGASDIVNGTPSLYEPREKEMETAIEEILKEIDERTLY